MILVDQVLRHTYVDFFLLGSTLFAERLNVICAEYQERLEKRTANYSLTSRAFWKAMRDLDPRLFADPWVSYTWAFPLSTLKNLTYF